MNPLARIFHEESVNNPGSHAWATNHKGFW